ncbi:MAG TPA: methyltransferase MtaB domain-containing protein [Candidatus Hydrogenedentes bacterium]|nr:methyltransferase MtaB domain-containing protein [Candidatus Hydrogenedentota bacterium]
MPQYKKLAIPNPTDLIFGVSPKPLTTRRGLVIGGGTVYPEINFTLPPMEVNADSMGRVIEHYREIVEGVLKRAHELSAPGVVIEFETLPDMTQTPRWGLDIARVLLDGMESAYQRYGIRSVLRMTPNDNREMTRPPVMRSGPHWESMLWLFDQSAAAGAELLSIESTGGKEIHDEALLMCDLPQVIFALCIMGVRDMRYLWSELDAIARRHGVHCAGDTACGFGNTAMVLAEQGMVPRVFAAVVRAVTAVRSLVAYECGAVGPGKDCGYENPILKAITGYPMSMEGKCAACAHLSPLGNIASATCDLWSNESIQNIKLLGGMAPTVSMEQLTYDCRLMNLATAQGKAEALRFRNLLVDSDAGLDPQAFLLSPENCVAIAQAIVDADGYYEAGKSAALAAIGLLRNAWADKRVVIAEMEHPWLDMMYAAVADLPSSEETFIQQMMDVVDTSKFIPKEYAL